MLLKSKAKFTKKVKGKKRQTTVEVCGRTKEELAERLTKCVYRHTTLYGWSLEKVY